MNAAARCINPFCRKEIPAVPGEARPSKLCAECAASSRRALKVMKDVGIKTAARAGGRMLEREFPVGFDAARTAYHGWRRAQAEADQASPPGTIEVEVIDTRTTQSRKAG